jgi:hypothetical protein
MKRETEEMMKKQVRVSSFYFPLFHKQKEGEANLLIDLLASFRVGVRSLSQLLRCIFLRTKRFIEASLSFSLSLFLSLSLSHLDVMLPTLGEEEDELAISHHLHLLGDGGRCQVLGVLIVCELTHSQHASTAACCHLLPFKRKTRMTSSFNADVIFQC